MDLSVQGLIDSIKLDGTLPDGMFTDSDYVKFLNEGFYLDVLAFIMRHREDYYLSYTDFTYSNTLAIPSDAIGAKLNDVVVVSSDGKTILQNLPRISKDQMIYGLQGFYIEGNSVKFYPEDTINEKIRLYYYKRPAYLELPENIATISSYNTGVATVDQIPTWVTVGSSCSITSVSQPYTLSSSSISATGSLTLTVSGAAEGDYICRSGFRAIADIPLEAREVLVQAAILKALISIKDKDGVKLAGESLAMAKDNASTILTPRVDNEPKKISAVGNLWRSSGLRSRRGY